MKNAKFHSAKTSVADQPHQQQGGGGGEHPSSIAHKATEVVFYCCQLFYHVFTHSTTFQKYKI
jgi:hypothetical protein